MLIFFTVGMALHGIFAAVLFYHKNKMLAFWPPSSAAAWQKRFVWWTLRALILCVCMVAAFDWQSLAISNKVRYFIFLPCFIISFSLGTLAFVQLGWRNTHGDKDKLVQTGLYRISRNPQYLFYAIGFVAFSGFAGSLLVFILLMPLSLWYLAAPYDEEPWLIEHYGNDYLAYMQRVPRYF